MNDQQEVQVVQHKAASRSAQIVQTFTIRKVNITLECCQIYMTGTRDVKFVYFLNSTFVCKNSN